MVRSIREKPDPWAAVLAELRAEMADEDFRRWFGPTAYASDSGDQITVWVPSESIRRHIQIHFKGMLDRALEAIGRADTNVRLVVAGMDEDEVEES
jgi:chromosomal replication initiation ATPase DnaA